MPLLKILSGRLTSYSLAIRHVENLYIETL
jgi:hypothetical protein